MFWCSRALQASLLWCLIASQSLLCGENEVEVGHSGLSEAQSHRSRSGVLTPSRFLMDFRRQRQTHSWAPNKLIRVPQICGSHISPRMHHPNNHASPYSFSVPWHVVTARETKSTATLCTSQQCKNMIYCHISSFSIKASVFFSRVLSILSVSLLPLRIPRGEKKWFQCFITHFYWVSWCSCLLCLSLPLSLSLSGCIFVCSLIFVQSCVVLKPQRQQFTSLSVNKSENNKVTSWDITR